MTNPLVGKDIEGNAKVKGDPEGKKGRSCIKPEQLGHDVQTSGEYEYCLGCGRCLEATHTLRAPGGYFGGVNCKPVT
eukprot:12194326-Heterocapsa_arctica.AAC.1